MEARVRKDYALPMVQAHTGRIYVKDEWRRVPDGDEAAMIEDILEYRDEKQDKSLDQLSKAELVQLAKDTGVSSPTRKNKAELIELLNGTLVSGSDEEE